MTRLLHGLFAYSLPFMNLCAASKNGKPVEAHQRETPMKMNASRRNPPQWQHGQRLYRNLI